MRAAHEVETVWDSKKESGIGKTKSASENSSAIFLWLTNALVMDVNTPVMRLVYLSSEGRMLNRYEWLFIVSIKFSIADFVFPMPDSFLFHQSLIHIL